MPGILDRISAALGGSTRTRALARTEERFSVDQWVSDFLVPFTYNGVNYVSGGGSYAQQRLGDTVAEITNTLPAYAAALRSAPPAFAAELVRSMILSQARFVFRNRQNSSSPRRTFGTRALSILEDPDPSRKLTTAKMLGIAEWHAGVAGNAFVYRQAGRRPGDRPVLRNLRPDWTAVIWGSQAEPDRAASALDNDLLGYVYWNGGYGNGSPWTILPSECAHWAPIPDPENPGLGQSWVTPALREMQGDRAATEHKLTFFRNGATPSLLVKGIAGPNGQPLTKPQFDEVVDMMEARHSGSTNAYKTLYLTGGADATVIGTDLKQVDFTAVQGRGETRVAFLSRVPASLLGISEGMQGSALNAGNFGMARRIFADSWVYPTLQDLAGALSAIVDVPSDAELWFDVSDMPILREDSKDQAEIQQIQAGAISSLINAGYEPDSVVRCVQMGDLSQLKHTGLYSVQLQPPQPGQIGAPGEAVPELPPPVDGGETVPPEDRGVALIGEARSSLERSRRRTRRGGGGQRPIAAIGPGSVREPDVLSGQQWRDAIRAVTAADRPDDEPIGELDEESLALLQALDELSGEERAFNPSQPRNPKGSPGGGRFRSMVDHLKDAIEAHREGGGKGHPFDPFDREQLRRVARKRGIELTRGESKDSIAAKLLDHLGGTGRSGKNASDFDIRAKKALHGPLVLDGVQIKLDDSGRGPTLSGAVLDSWTDAEAHELASALDGYRGSDAGAVNDVLRYGDRSPHHEDQIVAIDRGMESSTLPDDAVVYRGLKDLDSVFGTAWDPDASAVGLTWRDDGYTSTTADPVVAQTFAAHDAEVDTDRAILRIVAPRGLGALRLSDYAPNDDMDRLESSNYEAELLLQRGLTLRVVADHGYTSVGEGVKVRNLDVEVVPA